MEKFVEILAGLVGRCPELVQQGKGESEGKGGGREGGRGRGELSIIDMGCGMGYLTFAAHSHFFKQGFFGINTVGVENRQKLVDQTNGTCVLVYWCIGVLMY
mgnify:CR=1 FL=1